MSPLSLGESNKQEIKKQKVATIDLPSVLPGILDMKDAAAMAKAGINVAMLSRLESPKRRHFLILTCLLARQQRIRLLVETPQC
jgi:hypothetical protein